MTSTESYTAVAAQARQATEKSVDTWKQGAKSLADQATVFTSLPTVDLTEPVARYYEYVQKSVDLNRHLATRWAELLTALSGSVREQAETFSHVVQEQTDSVAGLVTDQARKAEDLARQQADLAEEAKAEQEKLVKKAERAAVKQAKEQAREPYEDLTKAELADQLAERGLPKTGNVDELIERLVSADSE